MIRRSRCPTCTLTSSRALSREQRRIGIRRLGPGWDRRAFAKDKPSQYRARTRTARCAGPRGQIDPAAVGGKRALRPWTDVACRERDSGDPKLAAPRQRCSCPCKLSSAITAHPSQSWRSGGVRLLPSPTFSDCISKRNQAIKPSCRNPRSRSRHHTRADVLMVGECGVLPPAGIPIIGVPGRISLTGGSCALHGMVGHSHRRQALGIGAPSIAHRAAAESQRSLGVAQSLWR